MNFLSMDYFLMTAEKRSFTKAADALHITQQTLSTQIWNRSWTAGSLSAMFLWNSPTPASSSASTL